MDDINPIKNAIDLPVITSTEIFITTMIVLFIVISLSAWLFYRYYKKHLAKKENKTIEPVIEINHDEIIRDKLNRAKKIFELGDYKEFHLKIAEILRYYFDKKYNCNALTMTSLEINNLKSLLPEQKIKINEFFQKNDEAKFAGLAQEKNIALDVLRITEEIISH